MLNKKFPQMNFHPNIVMIYALLSLKCRESNLRAFLIQKLEFRPSFRPSNARIFAKKSARIFLKMSPSEELATLIFPYIYIFKSLQ